MHVGLILLREQRSMGIQICVMQRICGRPKHDTGFTRFQVERLCCKIITCTEIGMAVCEVSYSQAGPGRELTQPSPPRLLAEPCRVQTVY